MNDRYQSLATPVDLSRAEALRRQLYARLVAGPESALITAPAETEPEELLMSIEELDHTTPTQKARRSRAFGIGAGIVLAAAAVVTVAVVISNDDETNTDTPADSVPAVTATLAPTSPPTTAALLDVSHLENSIPLAPGRYALDPDLDPTTALRVVLDVPLGWLSWIGAYKEADNSRIVVSITTINNVVKDACNDQTAQAPAVGPTVDDLATALSRLAPFQVTSAPSDVTIYGYSGKHLQLAVPEMRLTSSGAEFADCVNGNLMTWMETPAGGFYAYNTEPGTAEEFWILDVDGTRLMISAQWSPSSAPKDVAEMRGILDSIRIEP